MRDNLTGLFQLQRTDRRTDLTGGLFPNRVHNAALLDYYGESQLAQTPGGDFFDFIQVDPNGLIVVSGNVSGQSAAAAAQLVPGIRSFLRTRFPGAPDIRRGVRDLNRTICDTSPDMFYATLFCARFDPERRELQYVNAGHEPALLVRAGGDRVYRLESTGTVLGLTTRAGYGLRSIALEPGDVLATFTDGVAETPNAGGEVFGSSGVLRILFRQRGARASELVWCVEDAVRRFAGPALPACDRTITVTRFNGIQANLLTDSATDEESAFAAA
jgi:sigma-B regulation protein RsbU (phosphoserine phosphatase)